jgi:galactose mutarotase-like enzyme
MPVFTLTDTARDIWLDQFDFTDDAIGVSIRKRTLRGGLRDGVDLIEIGNGPLTFSVLPTRGLGLWRGSFRGVPLGWQAPVLGPVHPKFVNLADRDGLGWLQGFDEWLCRCGLNSVGPPGQDGAMKLTLHGRIANQPADRVEVEIGDDPPRLTVRGEVEEGGLFYPRLRLSTTYATEFGSSALRVGDQVTNLGGIPSHMQLLYHVNFGPPLLGAGSRVHVPVRELWPMTAHAAAGLNAWPDYGPPQVGFVEQVYCMTPQPNGDGQTLAVLRSAHAQAAVALRFSTSELPCFTVWNNTAAIADGYVTGLEPATCFPRFRALERQAGRVITLAPGESWSASWTMEFADSQAGAAALIEEVERLQGAAQAVVHLEPLA